MRIVETIAQMKQVRRQLPEPVGFVPTMGYLHEGHLTLVRHARAENKTAVVSIFVNPTQFLPSEDFAAYPRDTERDFKMLETVNTDIVFLPGVADMYPSNCSTWVDVTRITERLEGAIRPGHFRGVATVVAKLFNIVEPHKVYFGQKDAQQVAVVKRMVADLNMNLEIVNVSTVREPDGLAMSSRNIYLNPAERRQAAVLYRSLLLAKKLWTQGEKDAPKIISQMTELIRQQPLANIDYISIADGETLAELAEVEPPALVSMVVKFGKTRLLDNIMLE